MSARVWITEDEQGRKVYLFHQSWLSDTDLCLERARAGLAGEMPQLETDATAVGTAVHAAIEKAMLHRIEKPEADFLSFTELEIVAQEKFLELEAQEFFAQVKRSHSGSVNYITKALGAWYERVYPKVQPLYSELYFGPYTVYEDDEIVIQIAGFIDMVDARRGLLDWKTGSAHSWQGKDWEKQRWSLQATMYTLAWAIHEGMDLEDPELVVPFTFVVMLDNGDIQTVPVTRRPHDWAWLIQKALSVVDLIEADLPSWPRNDQHALCSPKWCPIWDRCKGAHVAPSWPT